jgi:hypothetical protein
MAAEGLISGYGDSWQFPDSGTDGRLTEAENISTRTPNLHSQ